MGFSESPVKMRLGLFINGIAKEGAICAFDLVCHARAMGHAMSLYAPEIADPRDASLWTRFERGDLESAEWWHAQELDLAIFYSFNAFSPQVLRQARNSGATVIVECDSDGTVSPLQSPFWQLRTVYLDRRLPWLRLLRSSKAWAQDWLVHGKGREETILNGFDQAHFIKIESEIPAEILRAFLHRCGRSDLARKVVEIPFSVRECFTGPEVPERKEPVVLLAGRLSQLQKGPVETLQVIQRLAAAADAPRIEMHVRGESPEFDALAARHPNVSVHHDTPALTLAERLRAVQVVFSRSRWETTPVLGLEALCSGCTLVAPRELPGYASLIGKGQHGQTYARKSTHEAVDAILHELSLWRAGKRDARRIAEHWRSRCSLDAVIGKMVDLWKTASRTPLIPT
jgi:Glycosyl transferases group 1